MAEDRKTTSVMADEGRRRTGVTMLVMANGEDGRSEMMMGEDGDGSRWTDSTRIREGQGLGLFSLFDFETSMEKLRKSKDKREEKESKRRWV